MKPNNSVDFAVIPAAGVGSRWFPISSFIPKEMLPFGGIPVIEWVIREAIESGCRNIILIINKDKEVIKRFVNSQKDLTSRAKFHFIYQKNPKGVADAIYCARRLIERENFALLFPDMPSLYKNPPLRELIKLFAKEQKGSHAIAFARYPQNNMLYYGEFLLRKRADGFYKIVHLCPKANSPKFIHHKGNRLRGAGRNIFSPEIFPLIEKVLQDIKNREVWDGDFLDLAFKGGHSLVGVEVRGFMFDIGTPSLYQKANWKMEELRKKN